MNRTCFLTSAIALAVFAGASTMPRTATASDPPAVRNPLDAAPAAKRADAGTIHFVRTTIVDAGLHRDAASFLVPKGWKTEGGVAWVNSPFVPARLYMRSYNPDGAEQMTIYPMFTMISGMRQAIPMQASYWPEGSFYIGNEVRELIASPGDFITRIVIPRERKELAGARVVGYEELPQLAQAVAESPVAKSAPGVEFRAGRLIVVYQACGHEVEEAFYCVLYIAPENNRTRFWGSQFLFSCRAEKGRLDEQTRLQMSIVFSGREDIGWWNAVDQIRQLRIQDEYAKSDRVMQLSRYITRVYNDINDMRRQSYEYKCRTQSECSRRFCETIRGVQSYSTPFENYPVQLPNGYNYAWTRGSGEYIMSNDPGFDPNQHASGNWQLMNLAR